MQTVYPSFYKDFICKAEKCGHSCCRGWEIDIDDASMEKYQSMDGQLGLDLMVYTTCENGVSKFILNSDDQCPFLLRNGLCRLIIEGGEDLLCNICASHPRFYTVAGDFELAGTGLSCEKTCELLLADDEPLMFFLEGSGEKMDFYQLIDRLGFKMLKNEMLFVPGLTRLEACNVLDTMARTEPIDDKWVTDINNYREYLIMNPDILKRYREQVDDGILQKIYQYIVYRQLTKLTEATTEDLLIYADCSMEYIFIAAAISGDLHEAVRRWSEQIEYCTENVDMLLLG
ncbi:MAG: flagellin lysine-N-methylase [Anaerovibrio sp.]|uniref:flagellin lysine-N-methylase n=1 Tax=Anaerovibrio sp. TaxID=1872532 RepID=UPI0025DB455A|nr:flagellin lysine-N-methylase [Anaerovibrio sp.]MCR5177220.1 flagellin lysine-N-methylase [Anaerovibrio sp.]